MLPGRLLGGNNLTFFKVIQLGTNGFTGHTGFLPQLGYNHSVPVQGQFFYDFLLLRR